MEKMENLENKDRKELLPGNKEKTHLEENFLFDIRKIIDDGKKSAYSAVSKAIVATYWAIGKRIVEQEQDGNNRAGYGDRLIDSLSEVLTHEYGKGFSPRNLREYRQFYVKFPDSEIWHSRVPNLTWTHFRMLFRVENQNTREWYMNEASHENWSVRTLDRNIQAQYFERRLSAQKKGLSLPPATENSDSDSLDFIKNPLVTEFLGLSQPAEFNESQLEQAIIDHLQSFIMELGRGFSFVARQKHILTECEDYFIDLVFYNFNLKCFVLIDLKTKKITHQDVGQMDMYVRMFDEKYLKEGHNPTLGILLCSETDPDIAKYSILHDSQQIFASKYMTEIPSPEELQREIERQKKFFQLQQKEKGTGK